MARLLWETGAVKVSVERPFQLASGNFSPLYINCRALISNAATMDVITAMSHYLCASKGLIFDIVAGGETAGIPFASYISGRLSKPMVYIRKKPKGYGMGSLVEGVLKEGDRVLLVEDLITDGKSKEGFISAIRGAKAEIGHTLVVFDREQGGREFLNSLNVELHPLCTLKGAIADWSKMELIPEDTKKEIESYLENPQGWHEKRGLGFK
ncbi:orotate phosphoribosyltransferase [Candidatus Magnetominusculus dajiuhuensis]|uniref:orotate phosphoribosyltransferase n=1 Tax=Candidatus Magnetominusculus dajiuhuensis TaxID=3137712 RepID=UPI003B430ED4